jgi:GT2 family glycosyltransferase
MSGAPQRASGWPHVAIVIVNWNDYDETVQCLKSLESISYPNYDVTVVDNGSHDASGERLGWQFANHRHIRLEENRGFTGGNNVAIESALNRGADYVLLLNNDTIVTPNFLEPLVERMESNPKIAAVTGKIYYAPAAAGGRSNILWYAGSFRKWWMGFSHYGIDEEDRGAYDVAQEVAYASGCEMLLRSSVLRQLGPLSDDYFAYWEESDWCQRARKAGYVAYYEPKSVIFHACISSQHGAESAVHNYLYARNGFIFAASHEKGLRRLKFWLLFPLQLVYLALWDIRRRNYRSGRATLWGVIDFMRGYRGAKGLRERGLFS